MCLHAALEIRYELVYTRDFHLEDHEVIFQRNSIHDNYN